MSEFVPTPIPTTAKEAVKLLARKKIMAMSEARACILVVKGAAVTGDNRGELPPRLRAALRFPSNVRWSPEITRSRVLRALRFIPVHRDRSALACALNTEDCIQRY
jgi:hypothetical protein